MVKTNFFLYLTFSGNGEIRSWISNTDESVRGLQVDLKKEGLYYVSFLTNHNLREVPYVTASATGKELSHCLVANAGQQLKDDKKIALVEFDPKNNEYQNLVRLAVHICPVSCKEAKPDVVRVAFVSHNFNVSAAYRQSIERGTPGDLGGRGWLS